MSGIYLHIPFCKQACHYCDFHFSTNLQHRDRMVRAIAREVKMQQSYLPKQPIQSIYFGGGTPSLLTAHHIDTLFSTIKAYYTIAEYAEITLEANPDDLNEEKLEILAASPVNRLSIGVQSFREMDLQFMNRAHRADEAKACIALSQQYGFSNLTVDLIYGIPDLTDEAWLHNIDTLLAMDVPHISCYCLTVEPHTALHHFVEKGKVKAVDEEQAARQFELLIETLTSAGFDHYEISNFAKPGHHAVHNANYWKGVPYLGVGPSAHSFDGKNRQWNVRNNGKYMRDIEKGTIPFTEEKLSDIARYNEYIMTGLRTTWGVDTTRMEDRFRAYFHKKVPAFLQNGTILQTTSTVFVLSTKGRLLADRIAMEFFWEE